MPASTAPPPVNKSGTPNLGRNPGRFRRHPNGRVQSHGKGQTKALLGIGFGGLLLLMCVLSASSVSFLYKIEKRHEAIRQDYVKRDSLLEKIRAGIYVAGTDFRDFMLEDDDLRAARDRDRFAAAQSETQTHLADYERQFHPSGEKGFQEFRNALKAYFATLAPALAWNAPQRRQNAADIIERQLLPRRLQLIGFSDRVQQSSERQLETDSQGVSDLFASFRTRLLFLSALTITIGVLLAAITMWRLLQLERVSEASYREAVEAREELKQLSAELVSAQENERRRISRELHDEVGQVLSAMMLSLGNVRAMLRKESGADGILRHLQSIEDMTERSAKVVRNLSLALRPTMLDDLGLIAALKWLAREVSRGSSLQVEVTAADAPDELPEDHRTCVYRVVQEAIRNASRHSGARHARISVGARDRGLEVVVQDDGKGFDPQFEKGMGILGMEERVTRLAGALHIDSEVGRGTRLTFALPLPESIVFPPEAVQETRPFRTA